jgi:hypothetical protein
MLCNMQNFFFFFTGTFCVPQLQIKVSCNHPLVLLQRPNDKATEKMNCTIKTTNLTYCNSVNTIH